MPTPTSSSASEKSLFESVVEKLGSKKKAIDWLMKTFPEIKYRSRIRHIWRLHGRPKQLQPITKKDWRVMFIMTGRRFGKTTAGSQTCNHKAREGKVKHIAIIGQTFDDTRKVMIEGQSGILQTSPPWFRPDYYPSKKEVRWPNGVVGHTYSGDRPDQLRGPGHGFAWADEIAKWKYAQETIDMLKLGISDKGICPQVLYTGTPLPTKTVIKICKDPRTVMVTGDLRENADNLSPEYIEEIITEFAGTRAWLQEVEGRLLEDNPLGLWFHKNLDANRESGYPPLVFVVVGVDPNISDNERSNECGIVVVGLGEDGQHYILGDYSMRGSPEERGRAIAAAYNLHSIKRLPMSDYNRIVYESNQGGDLQGMMIGIAIPEADIEAVHASKGKRTRAEPIAMLHERGVAHMVGQHMEALEDQLCDWVPGEDSPDRLDAMVWAQTWLLLYAGQPSGEIIDLSEYGRPDLSSPMALR